MSVFETGLSFAGYWGDNGWLGGRALWALGRLDSWAVEQLWARPLSNRVRTATRKMIPRFVRYSQDSCYRWWPVGIIDFECGCTGVLTSPASRHPPILRTLPFAPHCSISHPSHTPTLPLHRYGLGVCFLRSGRLEFAKMHLEKAVEVHPRNAIMLKSLGEVSGLVSVDIFDCCGNTSIRVPSKARNDGLKQTVCDLARVIPNLYTPILTLTRATPGLRTPQGPGLCARAVPSDIGTPAQFGDVFVQTGQAAPHTGEISGPCVLASRFLPLSTFALPFHFPPPHTRTCRPSMCV